MCILCIIEGFLEYIGMIDRLEMGEPVSEEEERALFERLRSGDRQLKTVTEFTGDDEYITITHKDGVVERFKPPK